jgi:hypothetical protein
VTLSLKNLRLRSISVRHIDDFPRDVEESILNSRGWVLQERALSRRILHFSDTQTYWEWGVRVHCETFTLMYKYV